MPYELEWSNVGGNMGSSIYIREIFLYMAVISLILLGYSFFDLRVEYDAFTFARIFAISYGAYYLVSLYGFIDILYWNQGIGKLILSLLVGVITELLVFKSGWLD